MPRWSLRRTALATALLATALLATAGAPAAALAQQGSGTLGPEQVKSELVGKTWAVKLPDGSPATEYFNADGTVRIIGGLDDTGKWRLSDHGYCTTWRRMRSGAGRCFTLERTADGQIRIYKPDGTISMTIVGFK